VSIRTSIPGECHWHPDVPDEWPTLRETVAYRDKVRGALLESFEALAQADSTNPIADNGRVFQLVLEHEYMHQETLLYMLQQAPLEQKIRPPSLPGYSFRPGTALPNDQSSFRDSAPWCGLS
jgi:hypothetical protein